MVGEIGDSIKIFLILIMTIYNTAIYFKLKRLELKNNLFWGIFILQIAPNILYIYSLNLLIYNCC